MAKTNRPGASDNSGFVRRTLAAASLVTALSGAANAQGNKAPDAPEAESERVVETVKVKTGEQLASELGLAFTEEDLRKINESGNDYSHKGTGYFSKKDPKPLQFEQVPSTLPSGVFSPTVRPVPQFAFTTDSGERIGTSFDPASGQAGANIEKAGDYRADVGILKSIGSIKDTRLKASYQTLYAGKQLGFYIGVEKGSEVSKVVVANNLKVENGMLKITAAVLKRFVEVSFPEVGVTAKPELTQKAIGIDYTRGFSRESFLQELKTSVVYYDVNGKNLGTIGHIIVDNASVFDQTRVDGGVRGGNKLLAELGMVVKITETLRADVSVGAEFIKYEAMFDTPAKTKTSATGGVGLTYQPDAHNKFSVKGRASGTSTALDLRYEHDFGNGVSGFVEAGRTAYSTGIEPETRVMAGVNIAIDGKRGTKAIAPLYTDWSNKTDLALADLNPNPLVATDTIQVMERVIFKEHEVYIDKSSLPAGSKVNPDKDGTIQSLDINTGATNLVSISATNLPSPYSSYLSVQDKKYLRITNLRDFSKIAPIVANVSIADDVGTFTLVSVNIQKGSSVIATAIERLSGVSPADAAAFVAGTKTIAQIIAGSANTAPTESDVVNQTVNEDGSITANVAINDAQTAAASLVFTASTNNAVLFPPGSIVLGGSGANRTITLTPAPNVTGTATVTYTTTDPGSLSVTKTFLVTVNAVDDAPIFQAVQSAQTFTAGSVITAFTAPLATDIDSGSLTYSMSGLPAGLAFNPATRQVSGTPTATGTFTVTYSVTDGTNTVTQTFQIVVNAAHVPPVMGDVPNQSASTGIAFNLNLSGYVTATNGDAILGYAIASGTLPPGLALNTATGAITGTPTTVGAYSITVLTFDTDGNSNADSVSFNVTDGIAPNAPTITAGYDTLTASNSVTVEVNGEIGTSVWVNGADSGVVIGGTGKANVNLDTSGVDGVKNFSIVLKDSQNQSTGANVSITVDRSAPTTLSMPVSGVTHNSATATFTVSESGTGYYLFQASALPAPSVATLMSTGTSIALTANNAQAVSNNALSASTPYTVYFVAKDGLNNAQLSVGSVSFTTSATPNTAPTVSVAPSNQSVGKNVVASRNMTVADTESAAATLVVTATSSNQSIVQDSNVVVSSPSGDGTRTITVTPEAGATGTVTINYQISDGSLVTSGSYTVTFTNSAPVIISTVSNQAYDQGVAIAPLTLPAANDSDVSDSVTYSLSALPAGLTFNPATRQISGTPTAGAGTYPMTFTATDGSGVTDVENFNIVISANVAPTLVVNGLPGLIDHNTTVTGSIQIADSGIMTVTLVADNGGRISIANSSGGTIASGNNTGSVTITGAASGTVTFNLTTPSGDAAGSGGESLTYTVTDSGGLSNASGDFYFFNN